MRIEAKDFEKFFEKDCKALEEGEVLRPTRVVYKKWGTIITKVFPTAERAWEFAVKVENLIIVQDVKDPIPAMNNRRGHRYSSMHKFGLLVRRRKA